jgi:glycosyltransferase involved in cell wall biosynthesis
MHKNKLKVTIVLPAYNAAQTLEQTVRDIPKGIVDEIILVDDFSGDDTTKIAKKLNLIVVRHKLNLGYGANQKTCYKEALKRGADIVVMLHPDYQYDPKLVKYFVEYIRDGYFDCVLGSRIRSRKEALVCGMPRYKYYSNRFLSLIENLATGHNLGEWHTGMRAYKKEVLQKINFSKNSNDFIFDSQVLFQIVANNFRIGEIPVPVRYQKEASSINFKRSLKYGLGTLYIAIKYCFTKKV